MGVVDKAEDVKLHRFVALKLLPSKSPRMHKLERVSNASAGRVRPEPSELCTIYEIDDESGQTFIAMEFLDGMTLKHPIAGRLVETEVRLGLAIRDPLMTGRCPLQRDR